MSPPAITHCLLCEDTRQEAFQKTTILGFVGVTPDASLNVMDFAGVVESINFLLIGSGVKGSFEVEPKILGPGGEVVAAFPVGKVTVKVRDPKGQLQLGVRFRNVKFPGPGRYRFVATFDDSRTYETTFDLNQGAPDDFAKG